MLLSGGWTRAADWPQFRGPNGSAFTTESGLPVRWSATENIRWKAHLPGRGLSSPVIAGDRVYVTACSAYQQRRLHVLCFHPADGKKLWERQFVATGSTMCHPTTCMAAPTPVTDGERVYALFATGDLACLDRDGGLVWYRSLVGDYPNISNQVGLASSPVLGRGLLYLGMENAGDSFALALDKLTGENRWKIPRARDINWVTPQLRRDGPMTEVLFQTGSDTTAYDAETGSKRWAYTGGASPVVAPLLGDDMIFVAGAEFTALRPGTVALAPEVAWKSARLRTAYASALYCQGKIYLLNNQGVLSCADARTGKIFWQQRTVAGPFWASPVAAEGRVYVVNEKGTTVVVQTGEKPSIVSSNALNETILATPALADGAVFLRSDQHLYCIGSRTGKPPGKSHEAGS
jgi:outer membrane protein assembly factor BamB